jgi:putative ABC transport system permease protein
MKTLGAKRNVLAKILVAEYSLLGILAGIIGSSFAALLSYAMCEFVLEIDWRFDAWLFVIGIAATAILVNVVGVAASYGILFKKPLSTLRGQ